MQKWSFHYLVSLGIAITNTISLIAIFRFKRQGGKSYLGPKLIYLYNHPFTECLAAAGEPVSEHTAETPEGRHKPSLQKVLKLKDVHLLAFFILIYVGVEVTIGGL